MFLSHYHIIYIYRASLTADIDLVDGNGTLQNLSMHENDEFAVSFLEDRQEYLLVQIERKFTRMLTSHTG